MRRTLLIVSAIAFFCLQITDKLYAAGILVALPFLIWFAVKRPQLARPRAIRPAGKALAALTAAGACLWPIDNFAGWLRSITVFQTLQGLLGVEMGLLSKLTAGLFAIAGLWFVYHMLCLFYERLFPVLAQAARDFTGIELAAVLVATALLMAGVVMVYAKTDAFASPLVTRDLIYMSDSGAIVQENAYLSLSALENDFRSPLFALFAAPLLGLPYLIGRVLPVPNAQAILLVAAQVPLMAVSFCLLMKLVRGVNKTARALLPVMMLATYGALLFTLMAEQYTVALFYLSLGLYALAAHNRREPLLILGAAGTMLPGAALALIPERQGKKLSAIVKDTLLSGWQGFMLLCTLGCFGVVLGIPATLRSIGRFTGMEISFADKFRQFLSFVGQIFVAPAAAGVLADDGYMKWRAADTGAVSVLGILLLALVCAGFLLSRRQRFAQLSMAWVGVSFVLLCVLGWGTAERGLTLYTLYFGWAYAALLAYLTERLLGALRLGRFSWAVYLAATAVLLYCNLPRLQDMVVFAVTNYPL